ncbi:GNAT family N-acetyltransferase [Flagellimonas sp.]|uniref:GNAT family N-acetyltransferase n=1 Tax=Flagellimonas sp. TaxID=2058762 RepID=UPI003B590A2E
MEVHKLNVSDYQMLRNTTDWHPLSDDQVEEALQRDLFSICVHAEDGAIGMGRVVGDGAIYFYVQDVVVHPKYKGKGIGKQILAGIEEFLDRTVKDYAFIGLMAAQNVDGFYHQFGYKKRADDSPGMYKVITK